VSEQDDGRLEDEDDRQNLDGLLDLAERVAGVEPLDRAVHLQLGHAQIHRLQVRVQRTIQQSTRHTASTEHSLTFSVRVMLPERHQWNPAVQATAVMLRTPPRRRPVTGQPATPISHIRRTILRKPAVTRQSPASSARTARQAFALCRYIAGWTQACN